MKIFAFILLTQLPQLFHQEQYNEKEDTIEGFRMMKATDKHSIVNTLH